MGRLEGKVAVITGGASGIGEGIVRRFHSEGARCVIADLQQERAEAVAKELGEGALAVRADVTVEEDVAGAVDTAVSTFGRLDCMVNNAGILGVVGPIVDTDYAAFQRTIAVLLHSVFLGIKHAGRVMIPQRSGVILRTASTGGVHAGLGPHVYTAAKHGVVSLTKSVAVEYAPHHIRLNCIAPGGTVSAMTARLVSGDPENTDAIAEQITQTSPLGRACLPEDIANAALFLASDEAFYISGACLVVDAAREAIGSAVSQFIGRDAEFVREPDRSGL